MRTIVLSWLLFFAGCLLTPAAVQAAPSYSPVRLNAATDLSAEHIGRFAYGMPLATASTLCGVERDPNAQPTTPQSARASEGTFEEEIPCPVLIGTQPFVLHLSFVQATLDHAELTLYEDRNVTEADWLHQAGAMWGMLIMAAPEKPLLVGPCCSLQGNWVERAALWTGKNPLLPTDLWQMLSTGSSSVGVALIGTQDPMLHVERDRAELRFQFFLSRHREDQPLYAVSFLLSDPVRVMLTETAADAHRVFKILQGIVRCDEQGITAFGNRQGFFGCMQPRRKDQPNASLMVSHGLLVSTGRHISPVVPFVWSVRGRRFDTIRLF